MKNYPILISQTPSGGKFIGTVPDLNVVAIAATRYQVQQLCKEAILIHCQVLDSIGESIPEPSVATVLSELC